jgi:hypothetical protein
VSHWRLAIISFLKAEIIPNLLSYSQFPGQGFVNTEKVLTH